MSVLLRRAAVSLWAAALFWGVWRHGATETWELYRVFLLAAAGSLMIAWTLPRGRTPTPGSMLPLLLAGSLIFLQIALRPTLEGRGYVLAALGWTALFLSLAFAAGGRASVRVLLLLLILAGGLEAIYGLGQALGEPAAIGSPRAGSYRFDGATGTFVNRNHFAGMLNLTLPLALGVLFTSYARRRSGRPHGARRRRSRSETWAWTWVMLLSCSFMGLAILLSLSRAGVLTLIVTLTFMSSLLALRRRADRSAGTRGGKPAGLALWLLPLTILGLGLAAGLDNLALRFAVSQQGWQGRTAVYADSLRLVRDHATFGVGPGMYRWRFRPYQTVQTRNRYDHAHNDYLETAADWGIPAAAAIWGFVLWRFYRAFRIFLGSRSTFRQGLALGCLGAVFSILLHSLVDFNLQIPTNLMILCAILGLAWSLESRADPIRPGVGVRAAA